MHASVIRYVLPFRTSKCDPNERTMKSCRERVMSSASVRGSLQVASPPSSREETLSAKRPPCVQLPPPSARALLPGARLAERSSAQQRSPRHLLPSSPEPHTMQPPQHASPPALPAVLAHAAAAAASPPTVPPTVPRSHTVPEAPLPSTLRKPATGEGAYSSVSSSRHRGSAGESCGQAIQTERGRQPGWRGDGGQDAQDLGLNCVLRRREHQGAMH